jgi:hypothetical protein
MADPYVGIFSAAIQAQNIETFLTTLQDGGAIDFSWQATFTPTTAELPEPRSFLLLVATLTANRLRKRNWISYTTSSRR